MQLGEVLFHDNPRRGRSLVEAIDPFRRATALEPGNLIARIHLARLEALADSVEALRATAAFLAEAAPESERFLEVAAIDAYVSGDTTQQRRVREQLRTKPWYYDWYASHGVARFARDPHGAAELLDARTSDEPLLLMLMPNLLVVRGQYGDFQRFMAGVRAQGNPSWDIYEAFVLTSGTYPASEEELAAVLSRLDRATPGALMSTAWLPPYEDMTEAFATFERDYHVAMLAIHTGRLDEARQTIAVMERSDPFPGLGELREEAKTALDQVRGFLAGPMDDLNGKLREAGYPEVSIQRPDARGKNAEARDQTPEVRNQ